MISDKDVSRFQEMYLTHFGIAISFQTARSKLELLVLQVKTAYLQNDDPQSVEDAYGPF